jgi:hypothetical protein
MKSTSVVNADYIISSLRQQMVLAGCLLQDNRDDADYIAEPRVGVLGTDGHDVNYGLPASQGLSAAASLVGGSMLPTIPEISLGRRTNDSAAAKLAVFAYQRKTKEPVWQSGVSVARSSAQAKWILGAGPFETGTIYEGIQFAGGKDSSRLRGAPADDLTTDDTIYRSPALWDRQLQNQLLGRTEDAPAQDRVVTASASEPIAPVERETTKTSASPSTAKDDEKAQETTPVQRASFDKPEVHATATDTGS